MKIAMIGAGSVGQTLGAKLIEVGHDVVIGVRDPGGDALTKDRGYAETLGAWVTRTGGRVATFAEAARHGDVVFNVTRGDISLDALAAAGAANLNGKVLVDVANALDFSRGMPPSLIPRFVDHTSLGEEIQKAFPAAKVVKAFNTIAAATMVNPGIVPGQHDLFVAGHDDGKSLVSDIARRDFGWASIVDLGDISGARAMEAVLPLWVRLWTLGNNPNVNIRVVR